MRKAIFAAIGLLTAISGIRPLDARVVLLLSYQELFSRSDLVVIATPTARTVDTAERSFLPNIFRQDS